MFEGSFGIAKVFRADIFANIEEVWTLEEIEAFQNLIFETLLGTQCQVCSTLCAKFYSI